MERQKGVWGIQTGGGGEGREQCSAQVFKRAGCHLKRAL